jgi:hypothetical protein
MAGSGRVCVGSSSVLGASAVGPDGLVSRVGALLGGPAIVETCAVRPIPWTNGQSWACAMPVWPGLMPPGRGGPAQDDGKMSALVRRAVGGRRGRALLFGR